jgi:serine/threonine-protein kinase
VFGGRYRVLHPLGAGAMGTVYEVLDADTDRRRALKVLHPRAGEQAEDGERWKREARIAGQIDSQFIVDVFDVGVDPVTGARFLVMELLQGEDLSKRLKRLGPLPRPEVALYLHQAAQALDRMHRAGIIHRDLKPGNLFRDERDPGTPRLKILDFGVAIERLSREAGAIAGTPMYMAPEQFRDDAPIGAATDVFALGMVAFAALTGRAYWTDEWERCGDRIQFAVIAVRGPTEPACARAARQAVVLPPEFDAWFARATAIDPHARFPSAGAAAQALGEVLGVRIPDAQHGEHATRATPALARGPALAAVTEPSLGLDSTITAAEMISRAAERSLPAQRSRRPHGRTRWRRRVRP